MPPFVKSIQQQQHFDISNDFMIIIFGIPKIFETETLIRNLNLQIDWQKRTSEYIDCCWINDDDRPQKRPCYK